MAFVEACRAWKAVAGQLPVAVSLLVEGEGWSGSGGLASLLRMYADELKADIGLAPAARTWCYAVPAINSVLRGVCREKFTIAVDSDQLARTGKGAAADPTRMLTRILSELHDTSGQVMIPGFYAGVNASLWTPHGELTGASLDEGDLQRAQPERQAEEGQVAAMSLGPTCEIDSVSGSRTDNGRLVTSPRAFAGLTFHLVDDQDPNVVSQAFRDFAYARLTSGLRIEFASGGSARPIRFDASSPTFRKALEAMTTEWERQAVFTCGDAEPAIHALTEALDMEVIVTAFPKRQDACGSPDEAHELANYRIVVRSWARILDALAR
jgi:acetylornithine deacetylase/succinyl-diaminopimelate desuccinylase-like protein